MILNEYFCRVDDGDNHFLRKLMFWSFSFAQAIYLYKIPKDLTITRRS